MDARTLIYLVVLIIFSIFVTTTSASIISASGFLVGDLSTYVQGDTIIFVYHHSEIDEDTAEQFARFLISTDAGSTWDEYPIPHPLQIRTRPTLTVLDDAILVSIDRYQYQTTDLGESWSFFAEIDNPFESAPFAFMKDDRLHQFSLRLPYPQFIQDGLVNQEGAGPLLTPYSYFTETEKSLNDTDIPFIGLDLVFGPVRSNSGLAMKQAGGGNNNGWPTFVGPVILGEDVFSQPSNYPGNDIFFNGLFRNRSYGALPTLNPLRQTASVWGNGRGNIYLVEVDGSSYSLWHGVLSPERTVTKDVYSTYPPIGDSELLFVNTYTVRDTIWTHSEGMLSEDPEIFVDGELWIKGNFSGKQSWSASGDIFIIGDITLSGTTPGQSPQNNANDFVNLISEGNVVIKYGYKNPADSVRIHPFLGADNDPHLIYANIYAIGDGHRKGVFTFEYQHPHPSIPAVELEVEGEDEMVLFDNIDIHRYRYPPTASEPWPPMVDLPYYNPLWPEARPYLNRGRIELRGNVYQRNKGHMGRQYHDQDYPSNSGIWDIAEDMCGGNTSPSQFYDPVIGYLLPLGNQHYPGAASNGFNCGYKLNILSDTRPQFHSHEDDLYLRFWRFGMDLTDAGESYAGLYFNEQVKSKVFDARDGHYLFAANDMLLFEDENAVLDLSDLTRNKGVIKSAKLSPDYHPLLLQYQKDSDEYAHITFTEINPFSQEIVYSYTYPAYPEHELYGFCLSPTGTKIVAEHSYNSIYLKQIQTTGELGSLASFEYPLQTTAGSELHLKSSSEGVVDVFIWEKNPEEVNLGFLHHQRVQIPVSNPQETVPAVNQPQMQAYPNPALSRINLKLKIPTKSDYHIDIYNIRGQKIRSLDGSIAMGKEDPLLSWDLKDELETPVSKGIYILRLMVNDKVAQTKKVTVF